jgi:hypothetical protein
LETKEGRDFYIYFLRKIKMQRDSFVFYESFSKAITILPEASQLHAFLFITNYGLYGIEPEAEVDPLAYAIFVMARPQIDANNKKFIY